MEELKQLTARFQKAIVAISSAIDMVTSKMVDLIEINFANKLTNIREMVSSLINDVSHYQHILASHIFVMMINNEQQDTKP